MLSEAHEDGGTRLRARLDPAAVAALRGVRRRADEPSPAVRPAALPLRPARRRWRGGRRPPGRARRPVDRHARAIRRRRRWSRRWRRRAPSGATRRRSASAPSGRRRRRGWRAGSVSTVAPSARRRVRRHQGVRGRRCRSGCGCAARIATPCCTRPSLPDLRDGRDARRAAGPCRCRSTRAGGSTCAVSDDDAAPGAVPVGQHARQPDRPGRRPRRGRRVGPGHGVPVLSATSATSSSPGTARRRTILEHGTDGVLAVHSLSKRSNLAGRARRLLRRRRRARALPGRGAQARRVHGARAGAGGGRGRAGRRRPRRRPARAVPAPARAVRASPAPPSASTRRCRPAASTCGRRRPTATRGASPTGWRPTAACSCQPGEFYGPAGAGHVRVAVGAARRPPRAGRPSASASDPGDRIRRTRCRPTR